MAIHPTAYIHERATVIGDVTLGARVSVWPSAVIRGDSAPIRIGDETNIQDGAIVHADPDAPATIGLRVTIGHRAIVHGATIDDDCLVGMGAILLNRVRVGHGSLIGAGAVCTEGTEVPPNSLVLGVPARVVSETTSAMRARIAQTARGYLELQEAHRAGRFPPLDATGRHTPAPVPPRAE